MIVKPFTFQFSSIKEKKTYICEDKLLALHIKKLLKKDRDIRIIKMTLKKYNIRYTLTVHYWSYADTIQTEQMLRDKYIFVPYGLYELITCR